MRSLPVLISGGLLGLFGIVGAGLVALSHEGTAPRIAANERQVLLDKLHTLVPPERIDNDMLTSYVDVNAPRALGAPSTRVYRGTLQGQAVAAVLSPVYAPGYAGPIQLILAVDMTGTLTGVRVLKHRETPGLGDKIEIERSSWIRSFDGKSLSQPAPARWRVKRDGGEFDQFTGATVTPRAVVAAVKAALVYFEANKFLLFEDLRAPTEHKP